MGIFNWFKGRAADPTKDWPKADSYVPVIDVRNWTIGSLRFGDDLQSARVFGRPDECRNLGAPDSWALTYKGRGFELVFENGQFVDVRFLIGYGGEFSLSRDDPKASPRLTNGERLTGDSRREDIIRCLGKPEKEVPEEDGTMLYYRTDDVNMEVELNLDSRLATWHLYRTQSCRR